MPHRSLFRLALPLPLVVAIAGALAPARLAAADCAGAITDAAGQPLPQATVELHDAQDRLVERTSSDGAGHFRLPDAPSGRVRLVAAKDGYDSAEATVELPLQPGTPLVLRLAVGATATLVVQGETGSGPELGPSGENSYRRSAQDIEDLPAGANTAVTDVLLQMPGVTLDQNQQIHIRDFEGPQFQYQINGVLVPLDINTNPPFISMINPLFIAKVDLLDGVLPSRYSYATGGVVDITTKDGAQQQGGSASLFFGQHDTIQPSVQFGGGTDAFSYYVSGLYAQDNLAFSSATPGSNAIHDHGIQGQGFGFFAYRLSDTAKLSLILSSAGSNNQLPNVPGLEPQYTLAGVPNYPSAGIDSYLNFRDYLGILALNGSLSQDTTYQLAYSAHAISQLFRPDADGELIYQGVASTASHNDLDNTLEADVSTGLGDGQTLSTGIYVGEYRVIADDSSLVFPVDGNGNQTSDVPVQVEADTHGTNYVTGIYLNDLWHASGRLTCNAGARLDWITGFTDHSQLDPTLNLAYQLDPSTAVHGGFARYMQVPSFSGISPDAQADFNGTTAEGSPGQGYPTTEDDYEWDIGLINKPATGLSIAQDNFFEMTEHYLDTGQFGAVPIFSPFNYDRGYIWGSELAVNYRDEFVTSYANLTMGRNWQKGVTTGQFNFDPQELSYIDTHYILLDHEPLANVSAGLSWTWRPCAFSLDTIYNTGLKGGFADQTALPTVWQVNASAERSFRIQGIGTIIDRITILNLFDRVNLIRPAEGIGIFQSAYGPRFTVYDTVTVPF